MFNANIHHDVYPIMFSKLLLFIFFLIAFVYGSMITDYIATNDHIIIPRLCALVKYIWTERRRVAAPPPSPSLKLGSLRFVSRHVLCHQIMSTASPTTLNIMFSGIR